jgi:hypothetical protein
MSADGFRQMTAVQSLAGGTAYASTDEAWEAIARAAGNDDAALSRMVAQGRQLLMQSGRVDQGGAAFGATAGQTRRMRDELRDTGTVSQETHNDVRRTLLNSVIDSSTPGAAIYGKPGSASELAQAHAARVNEHLANYADVARGVVAGTHTKEQLYAAKRQAEQEMAAVGGVYDAMSQAAPQNAKEFADGLIGVGLLMPDLPPELEASESVGGHGLFADLRRGQDGQVSTGHLTILDGMENLRANNREWAETRHDLGRRDLAQAEEWNRSHNPPPGGPGGPGGPTTGPPPGPTPVTPAAP